MIEQLPYVAVLLIVVGVLLWLVNKALGKYMAPPILDILNTVVVVVVVLSLLVWFLSGIGMWPLHFPRH